METRNINLVSGGIDERKNNRYGLVLAIAKNIVVNHKGRIRAKSNGNETVFEVWFKN